MPALSQILGHDRWFKWVVVWLFFFLLGTRGLNEPDEGRYAEIAREMVETGNWLVPTIWYVPHLDKPPMTCWLVGAGIAAFGLNEWAIRLPIALAGLSAAWAVFLLARSLGGRLVARWSVLILGTSLLFFAVARLVMTDMILLQFVCWAIYFLWRSWRSLDALAGATEEGGPVAPTASGAEVASPEDDDFTPEQLAAGGAARRSFFWQLAAWVMFAGGMLTKGPLVFLIPAFAIGGLLIYRHRETARLSVLLLGAMAGIPLFCVLALPWFWLVWQGVPEAFDYMVKGQVVGHALEAAAKNRGGPIYYFLPVLLVGFLPWSVLLGWLWRRAHWRSLGGREREGWVLLTSWAGLTLLFFSLNSAKLPHYLVPALPPLALLVAWRCKDLWGPSPGQLTVGDSVVGSTGSAAPVPFPVFRVVMVSAFLVSLATPIAYRLAFQVTDQAWIWFQAGGAALAMALLWVFSRRCAPRFCLEWAVGLAALNLFLLVGLMPLVESELRSNQSLRELGALVRREYRNGDALVIHQRIPQGLPLYAWPVINRTNRPYFLQLPQHRMPYAFPGNAERLRPYTLPDASALAGMIATQRVHVVGWRGSFAALQGRLTNAPLRLVAGSGHWELMSGGRAAE